VDTAVAGLIGAAMAAVVTLAGTLFGGRRDEIGRLWAENRARGADLDQVRKELDTERRLRQAAEDRVRTELAASEQRCAEQLATQEARCQDQIGVLEARIAGLGGA
jgi:hypothetical protein